MAFLQIILLPFAGLYKAVTNFRNHLYNIGYKNSVDFIPFVINVGNLSAGGTGKSPMIEYLVRLLQEKYPLAIVSRGYKRKTRGVRIAGDQDDATTLGDEPYQFFRKFNKDKVVVCVAEERILAVPEIMYHYPETEVILLDDAYQHRAIQRDLNILLTDFNKPFFQDRVLPVGRLREARKGAQRADLVIVTKCPDDLSALAQKEIITSVRKYAQPATPVFFSAIRYLPPQSVFEENVMSDKIILFTGIANSKPLETYVKQHYVLLQPITFTDHHAYTPQDIQQIQAAFSSYKEEGVSLLTTEKDMVKILQHNYRKLWEGFPLFYIPIEPFFIDNQTGFDTLVLQKIIAYQQSNQVQNPQNL